MSTTKNVVLVTGANAGIGIEIARQLMSIGSNYVYLGSRSLEKGNAAYKKLQGSGLPGTGEAVQLDVTNQADIDAAVKKVEKQHGKLDVLVNNAGLAYNWDKKPEPEHMLRVYATNVIGVHAVTEAFIPLLKKSTTKRIVHVSSGAASIEMRLNPPPLLPKHRTVSYNCSKAALSMLMVDQTKWYEDDGLKFFAVSPGFTESGLGPMNKAANGAKPVFDGAKIIVDVINGERDAEAGRHLHGNEAFHEKPGNGQYPW